MKSFKYPTNNHMLNLYNPANSPGEQGHALHTNIRKEPYRNKMFYVDSTDDISTGLLEHNTDDKIKYQNTIHSNRGYTELDILGAYTDPLLLDEEQDLAEPLWNDLDKDAIGTFDSNGVFHLGNIEDKLTHNSADNQYPINKREPQQRFRNLSNASMPLSARQSTETDYYYNEIPRKSYQWIYCDALNNIQGPFSDIKMQEWYEAGFFDDSLLVKREDALYFETLGALIQRIGNIKYAFLMDRPLNQISALSSPYHSLDTNDIYSSSDLNRTKLLTGNRSDGDPFERDQIKPHLYQSYHGNSFDQISNNRPSEVSSSIPPFIPSLSHPKASMDNYRYQPLKYGEADTFRGGYSMDPSFVNISQGQSYPFSATKSLYNEQPTLYPTMNDMGSISMDNYAYGLKQAMQQQYMNTHQQLLFQQKLLQQQLLLQHQQVCPVGIQPTPLAMHTKHDMRQGFFDGMQFNPPIAVTSPGIPHIPSPQIASSYGNISPVLEQSHDKVEIKSIDKEISEGMDRLVLTETARLEEKEYVEPNVENNKQGVKTITEQYFHLDESQEEQREVDNANLVLEITPNDSRVESPSVKIREDSGEDTNSSSSGNDTIELKAASDEFLKWCKLSLRGLNSGVNVDEIIQMLLSFPVDGSCSEIIQDMVYANSVSIDGRRFAHDFMTRRKADMEGKFDVRIPQSALLDDSFKVVTKKNKKRHPHPSS